MELLRYKGLALGALAIKSLPLVYGGSVILFVNTRLPRDSELGIYSLAMATFLVVSLLGKSFAIFPLIKHLAQGESGAVFWKAGATFWVGTQIAGAALIGLLAPLSPRLFHAPGLDQGLLWAAAITVAFIPRDLASALLQSRREMARLFILEGCYFLTAAAGICYLALTGALRSANQVLQLNLAAGILSTLAALFLCSGRIPRRQSGAPTAWSKMGKYGRDSLGIGVGDVVYTQLDYHLLGFFMGAKEVALYFAAKNFFRFYNALTQSINLLILPASSNLFARGDIEKLKELTEKVMGGYWGLLVLINAFVFLGADGIVALVYQDKFPDAANILRVFALASFFEPLHMIGANVLYGIGRPRAVVVAMWSSIVLFLLLAVILMPRLGAFGASLAILGTLISLSSITLSYLHREVSITPLSIFRRTAATARAFLGRL